MHTGIIARRATMAHASREIGSGRGDGEEGALALAGPPSLASQRQEARRASAVPPLSRLLLFSGRTEPRFREGRPRRSGAERRAQDRRAEARVAQRLVNAFAAFEHRGCQPSWLGAALAALLRPGAPAVPGAGPHVERTADPLKRTEPSSFALSWDAAEFIPEMSTILEEAGEVADGQWASNPLGAPSRSRPGRYPKRK